MAFRKQVQNQQMIFRVGKAMKLAEALQERSDLQKRISQLERRLRDNARVQEGEKPAEDPVGLLRELDESVSRFEYLISAINKTNSAEYSVATVHRVPLTLDTASVIAGHLFR